MGELPAVPSTVRMSLLEQGGGGPTMESVFPDYVATMSSHDNVAPKYPVEVMVLATRTGQFFDPKTPCRMRDGRNNP